MLCCVLCAGWVRKPSAKRKSGGVTATGCLYALLLCACCGCWCGHDLSAPCMHRHTHTEDAVDLHCIGGGGEGNDAHAIAMGTVWTSYRPTINRELGLLKGLTSCLHSPHRSPWLIMFTSSTLTHTDSIIHYLQVPSPRKNGLSLCPTAWSRRPRGARMRLLSLAGWLAGWLVVYDDNGRRGETKAETRCSCSLTAQRSPCLLVVVW